MLVHRLLERGNGAARQRLNAELGGMELLLRELARETVSVVTAPMEVAAAAG
jgi:carboxylate-amine ligase